ncbi:MAG: hypothetical protein NC299_09390 [Lachnospiraceae bacterium]|nr:hypothetical protein [Ruminococcus sp.]MCM1275567.1 hypothetical protein [Lachnospiraceae bacterium]
MLHMLVISMPIAAASALAIADISTEAAKLAVPIICQALVNIGSGTSPVTGSGAAPNIVVITKISIGITRHAPAKIQISGMVNIRRKSTLSILLKRFFICFSLRS